MTGATSLVRGLEQPAERTRINSRLYSDREVFEAELEHVFARNWVYVAHESQLKQPGDYVTTRIGREPVIVTRDENGDIHVLVNRCLHRGVTLCQYRAGNANFFRCHYHGWTYRNSGKLAGVTFPRGYGSEARELRREELGRAEVDSFEGLIFARLRPGRDVGLREHLGRAAPYITRFANGTPGYELELEPLPYRYSYAGNWKLQVENTVDAYHPAVTHSSFYEVMLRRTGGDNNPYAQDDGPLKTKDLGNGHGMFELGKARTRAEQGESKGDSYFDRARTSPGGERLVEELQRKVGREEALKLLEPESDFNLSIFPNLMIVQAQLRVVHPVAVDRTEAEAYTTLVKDAPDEANELRLRIVERFWGPCGFGSPDDLEIFERFHDGLEDCEPQWLKLSRGLEREELVDEVGVAKGSDEGPLRSFYRAWVESMREAPLPADATNGAGAA
jgi:anthranilate 1,2-dioxygenase (deaminating, decarboxylating) large subunit